MRFRKKPVVVEAFKLEGDDYPPWMLQAVSDGKVDLISAGSKYPTYAEITTLEGKMLASPGDWIIKGVEGELHPCKDSVFQKTYEFDADGVIDTWAGNWIISLEAPNGLREEQMLTTEQVEQAKYPVQRVTMLTAGIFERLWDRRDEKNPNRETVDA